MGGSRTAVGAGTTLPQAADYELRPVTIHLEVLIAILVLALSPLTGSAADVLRNWFDDPYFQVRSGIRGCPVPRGPFATEDEMRHETHYRSERGTRCWLEKKCSKPSSYLYDPDIAAALRSRFASDRRFRDASLWVTVQRRWAWIEGCVRSRHEQAQLERLARSIPDVELVIVNVSAPRSGPPPYRTMEVPAR